MLDSYKKWEGKSSGSAPELQEIFPEKAIPNDAKIGKKYWGKKVKSSKIPKTGNMNKIMDRIFPLDIQSPLQCQILPQSPLGFAVSRENSLRNE